jgi:hypothetical protein
MPHNRGEVLKGEPVPNYLVSPGASVNLKVAAGGEHYGDFPSVRTGCPTNAPGTMIFARGAGQERDNLPFSAAFLLSCSHQRSDRTSGYDAGRRYDAEDLPTWP